MHQKYMPGNKNKKPLLTYSKAKRRDQEFRATLQRAGRYSAPAFDVAIVG